MSKPKLPPRERIVRAAAELLADGGREAVSTRAVSAAANVQAPAIYRQFGDMRGLLEAAALQTMAEYVRQKAKRPRAADPVEDLRRGWDEHIAFGLANPDAYAILSTTLVGSTAEREGLATLHGLLARVAEAGRLRVSVAAAARLIQSGGRGVVLTLNALPAAERDPHLSAAMREALIAAITEGAVLPTNDAPGVRSRAVALRAVLPQASGVSAGERLLLGEWLDRLATCED